MVLAAKPETPTYPARTTNRDACIDTATTPTTPKRAKLCQICWPVFDKHLSPFNEFNTKMGHPKLFGGREPSELSMSADPLGNTDQGARRRVLIIIPCYNESGAIAALLDEIAASSLPYDTLVVDDGSTDATYNIAKTRDLAVRLLRNLGVGGAVQTGIKFARRRGYDLCIQLDGDGQHPPDQVSTLVAAYDACPANILIGSRYAEPATLQSTLPRRFGSWVIAQTICKLFSTRGITDPTSGLRLLDREAIALFADHYPHDYPEPISIARALRRGMRVREVAIKMRPRQHGVSSVGGLKGISYMVRVLFHVLLARIDKEAETQD
jgi:hypothetical protein